jgi:hypothetical protein
MLVIPTIVRRSTGSPTQHKIPIAKVLAPPFSKSAITSGKPKSQKPTTPQSFQHIERWWGSRPAAQTFEINRHRWTNICEEVAWFVIVE